ncbi:MAG: THUMP domain-containing protein [Myxococcota bacterium]|nr:THUMP domain-containing protein [Myxococcota bacterium]
MRFFATAAKGTEPALRDELRELRLRRVRADRGGIHFEGELVDGARACLWSRIATRILLEVVSFEARDAAALYEGIRAVDWSAWMTPETTVAVRASCRSSQLTHSHFIAQKTKDAVVDALRARFGSRPSVDKDDPDVLLAIHVARDHATAYLDMAGESLHARGWRSDGGDAPLRETLAAAVVRLSGWDPKRPLIDPMCGAGTIAIEAASWAERRAPGLSRPRFGFERWASHDESSRTRMRLLRAEAQAAVRVGEAPILAHDIDPRAVARTEANARAAGVALSVKQAPLRALTPLDPPGFVVTNPPYGERLESSPAFCADLARAVRGMHHHHVALLAGNALIGRAMGRDPDRRLVLYNGPIECRLLVYAIP